MMASKKREKLVKIPNFHTGTFDANKLLARKESSGANSQQAKETSRKKKSLESFEFDWKAQIH